MIKTIGILAHVDAGKTSLSEQILYHTKSIRSRGRVDHKNTFLDNYEVGTQKVQSHTSTVFKLLKKKNIPTFIFINKIDSENFFIDEVISDIKENLDSNIIDMTDEFKNEDFSEDFIDFIAERDEDLMEVYFESGYNKKLWEDNLKKQIKENKIYPVFRGSALNDINIESFIESFDKLTTTSYDENNEFLAKVCNVKYEAEN